MIRSEDVSVEKLSKGFGLRVKINRLLFVTLGLVLSILNSTYSHAQDLEITVSSEADVAGVSLLDSPGAVSQLVSRLSDNEVRDLLLERLETVANERASAVAEDNDGIFTLVTSNVPVSVKTAVESLPVLVPSVQKRFGDFARGLGENGVLNLLKGLVIVILLGVAAEFLLRRFTSRFRTSIDGNLQVYSLAKILKLLSLRLFLDLSGLIAFIMVVSIALRFFIDEEVLEFSRHLLWNLVIIPRLFWVFARFVFAPERSDLRLMHASDASAKFLHRHLVGVAMLIGLTLSIFDVFTAVGAPPDGVRIGFWFNLIIHLYFVYIAWRSRSIFSDMIDGPNTEATSIEKRVASLYPYYAMIVVVGSWLLVEVLAAQGQFKLLAQGVQYSTMFVLLLAPFLDTAIRALVRHMTPPVVGDGEVAFKAHRSTMRSYVRMGRVVTVMLVIFFIIRIWGLDLANLNPSSIGTSTIKKLLDFIGINAVGYLVWELVTLLLNKKLASENTVNGAAGDLPGGDEGGVGGSRLSTVLPLVIRFAQTSIIVMTLLISLGSIGVDTTPLLAGAGIVGLAIGFGAQKLVEDIVSGLFFLIDDAFRAGEYVNIEGTVGTVERISLRAMQLRHHRGAIHTIPYGEIPKITNYSRDWTIMKLTFTVPFETNLMKVKKIFKTIGQELMDIPEFADDFLSPFKSQGVIQVDDVGIVIRGKFMVKPGKQFMIRKEIFNRVQSEFEKNGIQFARKEVRVKLDSDDSPAQLTGPLASMGGAPTHEAGEGEGEPVSSDSSQS